MQKSKVLIFLILITLILSGVPVSAAGQPGTVLVKVKLAGDLPKLRDYGETELLFNNIYRLKVGNLQSSISTLQSKGWVEFAEDDLRLHTELNVTDPLFVLDKTELTKQWYLPKIQANLAWDKTVGSGITIAVIDTGIDARHEDLNDGRVTGGYLSYCQTAGSGNDCLIRITGDLAQGANSDDNGHGTVVAGVIGAIANNNKGIAGINHSVRLMPIKALDSNGSGLASDVALGIRWAADHGARIVNLSVGGAGLSGVEVLQEAITYAFNKGVLIVAAAGNDAAVDGVNMNVSPVLPVCADGGQNMVIGVAATDSTDRKARFSNYGSNCVDISAPGTGTFIDKQQKQGLVSTYFDPTRPGEHDLYVFALGTSLAAPMVSGTAGLMMSVFPDLDMRAIRDRLIGSVDSIDELNTTGCGGSCAGHLGRGRLNALKAVTVATTFPAGSVVRSPEGNVFLIERGLRRPISAFVFQQRFGGFVTVAAEAAQLDSYPLGSPVPPVDSTIVKEPANPTVYLVEGQELLALSYLAFISRGLRFENVVTLPADEMAGYTKGSDAPVVNGALVKSSDHPAVYILNNGMRQLLSFFVFKQRGFDRQPIAILSPDEIARYPGQEQGFLYLPVEGTLIRGDEIATVYVIEGGKRHGLNLAAFTGRGYSFANVNVVPQSELAGYELGEDILQ